MKPFKSCVISSGIACLLVAASVARPADFPGKPVRIVVGVAAGSITDVTARIFASRFSANLRQNAIIENRPGAGELVALNAVKQADADGYTLFWGGSGLPALPVLLKAGADVDVLRDLAPVSLVAALSTVIIVRSGAPYQNIDEMIAYMKANPGKVNFASGGSGGNLLANWFKSATKTDFVIVPYSGSAAAMLAVMSGDSDMNTPTIGDARTAMQTGKVKVIGYPGVKRDELLPAVPAFGESQLPEIRELANLSFGRLWFGIFAPSKTPRQTVVSLSEAIAATAKDAELQASMRKHDMALVTNKPEEFSAFIAKQGQILKAVAKELRIEPQ